MTHRKVLLIAYHFPPIQGSTGTSRTIAFSRYLKDNGWDARVLTIRTDAYQDTSSENEQLIPSHVRVERAWGLDTRRSFSILGRYPMILALPDRWQSWIVGGFFKGSKIIQSWRPDIIMSTYPIASAHAMAYLLQRKFHLPWVAEFRDPMLQPNYPTVSSERWAFSKVEALVFSNAQRVITTTDGCRRMYLERFPDWEKSKIETISNGYDPAVFPEAPPAPSRKNRNRPVLLHSGLLYPHERNPTAFFSAVRSLRERGFFIDKNVEFRFRASGNDECYRDTVTKLGIQDYVSFLPRISYLKAVEEMRAVDALMLFQADNCNDQIPAKTYEYFYAQKPVLGFTDPEGETGKLLHSVGIRSVAKLEDSAEIENQIMAFVNQLREDAAFIVPKAVASRFSRENLTADLSRVLSAALIEHQKS